MREVPVPSPKDDELLIKVEWTGANYIDNCGCQRPCCCPSPLPPVSLMPLALPSSFSSPPCLAHARPPLRPVQARPPLLPGPGPRRHDRAAPQSAARGNQPRRAQARAARLDPRRPQLCRVCRRVVVEGCAAPGRRRPQGRREHVHRGAYGHVAGAHQLPRPEGRLHPGARGGWRCRPCSVPGESDRGRSTRRIRANFTQLGKYLGAHVIATTSSEAKAKLAKENGAEAVLLTTNSSEDNVKEVSIQV